MRRLFERPGISQRVAIETQRVQVLQKERLLWPTYFFGKPRNGRTKSLPLTCFKLTPDILVLLALGLGIFWGSQRNLYVLG